MPIVKKLAWPAFRIAVIAYMCVFGLLACGQRKMLYFPSRASEPEMIARANATGMQAWRDASGEVVGWRAESRERPAQAQFLVFHGNAGSALDRDYLSAGLQRAIPSDVHLMEYPGYGARGGEPSQSAFLGAAEDALMLLRRGSDLPVILVGESIGSGVAAGVAHRRPGDVAGLLLITPFDDFANVAASHYPFFPVRLMLLDNYPSAEWLRGYDGPLAVVLAERDEVVPARFGRALYDGYAGPKRLWTQPEATHNAMDYNPSGPWWREMAEFLRSSAPENR